MMKSASDAINKANLVYLACPLTVPKTYAIDAAAWSKAGCMNGFLSAIKVNRLGVMAQRNPHETSGHHTLNYGLKYLVAQRMFRHGSARQGKNDHPASLVWRPTIRSSTIQPTADLKAIASSDFLAELRCSDKRIMSTILFTRPLPQVTQVDWWGWCNGLVLVRRRWFQLLSYGLWCIRVASICAACLAYNHH